MGNKIFIQLCGQFGIPTPVEEFKFSTERRYRSDYAWPDHMILLEQEGGIYTKGAHGSVSGILRDIEKYNLAATLGYRVLRVQPKDLLKASTFEMIKKCL